MYTQDVVCPKCTQITKVNVIEVPGYIYTPCSKCGVSIQVGTDANNQIVSVQWVAPQAQSTGCAAVIAILVGASTIATILLRLKTFL